MNQLNFCAFQDTKYVSVVSVQDMYVSNLNNDC